MAKASQVNRNAMRAYKSKRDKSKYEDCIEFGGALPRLRARVEREFSSEATARNVMRVYDEVLEEARGGDG